MERIEDAPSRDIPAKGTAKLLRDSSKFFLFSSVTLLSTGMSVATNKAIAVLAGVDGVALMGLYRGLGAFIVGVATCGSNVLLLQKASVAKTDEEMSDIVSAAMLLVAIQGGLLCLVALSAPGILAEWFFGNDSAIGKPFEIRIVFGMAFANLILQAMTSILRGKGEVRPILALQLGTALASLLAIFPLLGLGNVGLAINVGSGSLLGACLGFFFITRFARLNLSEGCVSRSWALLAGSGASSVWLTAHSLGLMGGFLALQSLLSRHYGLTVLGYYTAAMLIVDTAVMVLMSPARSQVLPTLGRLEDSKEKEDFFGRMFAIQLGANTVAALVLIFAAPYTLAVLFSGALVAGSEFLAILGISLIGQSIIWSYNTFLLHRGESALFVTLDLIWMAGLFGSVFYVARCDAPPLWVATLYTTSCLIGGLLYAIVVRLKFGRGFVNARHASQGALSLAVVLAAYVVSRRF